VRALIFSDLHGHVWKEFSELQAWGKYILNSRLVDAIRVLKRARSICEEEDISTVFFAGDLFHWKRKVDVTVYNAFFYQLRRLATIANVYLLPGNHDLVKRSALGVFSNEHSLRSLRYFGSIEVVDQPEVYDFDGVLVGFVPYAADRDTILSGLEDTADSDLYIMHAGVSGARVGSIEYQPLEPITVEDLPDAPIYSGHYHEHQNIQQLTYIGAPLEIVRGEQHDDLRGFIIVDLEKPHAYERVAHKGPRFVSVMAGDILEGRRLKKAKGNFVDLVITEEGQAEEAMKALEGVARAVVPVYDVKRVPKKARLKVKAKEGRLPSVQELADAYVDEAEKMDIHDEERLKRMGRELLAEAEEEG